MTVITRFAPSPSGFLHAGNMRTALFNWLFARAQGGGMILRLDDTDPERSTEAFARAIREDLLWMGLAPDREERQSARAAAHDAAFERLRRAGRVYPCYETPEELDLARARARARRRPPVYDRAALRMSDAARQRLEARGLAPHWRFQMSGAAVRWDDLVRGVQTVQTRTLSDPVIRRADGRYLYMLPSAVDDADFGVTHVIRGEDHAANTAAQIEMIRALGRDVPDFAHHPLLVEAHGGPLSKRRGGLSVRALREEGIEPLALACLLALAGRGGQVRLADMELLAHGFTLTDLGRAPLHFDEAMLWALNSRLLRRTPHADVRQRLAARGVAADEAFWLAIRGNIRRLADAGDWWQVASGPVTPTVEDAEFLATALALLPPPPWDEAAWGLWTAALQARTGRTGRSLHLPLRLALTGRRHGPDMKNLLPLISPEHVRARLAGRTA